MVDVFAERLETLEEAAAGNGQKRGVRFSSAVYKATNGKESQFAITIWYDDGNVQGMIAKVKEDGGIGGYDGNGVYTFIPWPPAVIEILPGDQAPSGM